MCAYEADFVITSERDCPLYSVNDRLKISGVRLLAPNNKPVCIILVQDIIGTMVKNKENVFHDSGKTHIDTFYCSGCTGSLLVKVDQRFTSKSQTMQVQLLEKLEHTEYEQVTGAVSNLLNTFTFFHDLEKESIQDIISVMKADSFDKGENILNRGEEGKKLYVIVSGKAAVLDAQGKTLTKIGEGEIFGEMSLLSGNTTSATIKAVEPLTTIVLSRKDIDNLLFKHPKLQESFTRLIIQRLTVNDTVEFGESAPGITGQLNEIPASELFQMFHENTKTGLIELGLSKGEAVIGFVDGEIVQAEYHGLEGQDAFFDILRERDGRFRFTSSLPQENLPDKPLGAFMKILMEGLRIIDEEKGSEEDFVE